MNDFFQTDLDYGQFYPQYTDQYQQAPAVPDFITPLADKVNNDNPLLFRQKATEQILSILLTRSKGNPLLIGPAGCGKTRLVEDLACKMKYGDPSIPYRLQGYQICELSLSGLMENTTLQGDVERKANQAVRYFCDPANRAICFIDEIHQLFCDPNYAKVSQILKPVLARNEFRLIGATTLQESFVFETDPAFKRRMSYVILNEFSKEETSQILKSAMPGFIQHYGMIRYSKSTLDFIVNLAESYQTCGLHRPDNALTLLDRSLSMAHLSAFRANMNPNCLELTHEIVERTAASMSGSETVLNIDPERLKMELKWLRGQEQVTNQIAETIEKHFSSLFPVDQPLTMLFAGSSGTGKTQAAKILAKALFGTKPVVINLNEFQTSMDLTRLIGSSAGYVGYDSKQELPFDVLRSNPHQVILLDELDKAPAVIQNFFMQMLDEGEITTSKGVKISFTQSVIIATTNAGFDGLTPKPAGLLCTSNNTACLLQDRFKPEFLNRFEMIAEFASVSRSTYKQILMDLYEKNLRKLPQKYSLSMPDQLSEAELDEICDQTYREEFGARPAKRAVQDLIYKKFRDIQ